MKRLIAAAGVAILALSGCSKAVEAPSDPGACFLMATQKDGSTKFNKIADGIKDIEHCALQIELVRRNFRRLGSMQEDYTGAFQGSFVFIQRDGIFTSTKLDGIHYPLLVRFQNELVMPGAIVEGAAPPGTNALPPSK
ncbi:MAG: hypothetical protein JWO33_971 [Caulobacteraceae bacterium]|nr:hypothetical protein [Caulobacteraceae bacterium]